MRLKAFPFGREVRKFAARHERIFVVEQNRDAQMRSLLINEAGIAPDKLIPVLNFDGMPLTAGWVKSAIAAHIERDKAVAGALHLAARAM
jgi:2-oxoglutarate ferredoxin oxidoreductase subunit alpha